MNPHYKQSDEQDWGWGDGEYGQADYGSQGVYDPKYGSWEPGHLPSRYSSRRGRQKSNYSTQSVAQQGDFHRGGYYSQGQSPNPGSHSYPYQYGAPYGSSYGLQSTYGTHSYGAQAYGERGWNAPTDEQLRQGSRLPYSDQPGYGQSLHTGFTGADSSQWRGPRRAPKSYQRSDERLTEDIYERLSNQWEFDATEVIVEVSSGKVVLKGSVPDRRTRHAIENIVDDAYGVKDIENNLRVESMAPGGNSKE